MSHVAELASRALIVNKSGQFVEYLGRVSSLGRNIELRDGSIVSVFNYRKLKQVVQKEQCDLVFVQEDVRLPRETTQVRDNLYSRLNSAAASVTTTKSRKCPGKNG